MQTSAPRSDITRSALLAELGLSGPMSRAALARALGVSPALITQISKRLLADGLLVELDTTPSTGGRPARLIGLATNAGAAIGVKVAFDHISMVETGIDGSIQRSTTEPFNAASYSAIDDLVAIVRAFVAACEHPPLLGVGVGIPGSVDIQANGVVDSTQLGWPNVPLGEVLRRELDVPVLIENNANAAAMAEALFGITRRCNNALVVTIGTGIGAGIIADGSIVRGNNGGAGDLGHFPTVSGPEALRCQCGASGCLETVAAQAALVRTAIAEGILPADTNIDDDEALAALRVLADSGHPAASEIFANAGTALGRTVGGAVNLLAPEIVVILGEGVAAWKHWAKGFEPAFRSTLTAPKRATPFAVKTWEDERWAQGAASLILSTPFDARGISGEQGRLVRELLDIGAPSG